MIQTVKQMAVCTKLRFEFQANTNTPKYNVLPVLLYILNNPNPFVLTNRTKINCASCQLWAK